MFKRNRFSKRIMALILASVVTLSGTPVGAAELGTQETSAEEFSTGGNDSTQEQENITGTEDNTSSETGTQAESDTTSGTEVFGDDSAAEAFAAPEETETFQDGTSAESGENTEGVEYIKGRPLTPEEEAEQLAPFENLTPLETPPRT